MAGIAGNDAQDARRERGDQYGEGASAEDLIHAHDQATIDNKALRAALEKPVDADATAGLGTIKPKFGGEVLSAAVRGGLIVVVEMVDGAPEKWSTPYTKSDSQVEVAEAQAAASVGGPSDDTGQAPPGTGVDGQGTPAGDGTPSTAPEKAPEGVTVEAIRAKLAELEISIPADKRKKDDLWALVPSEARAQLLTDAATAS